MKTKTVHVELLNEGVACWRPVDVEVLANDTYRMPTKTKDQDEEVWAFEPGEVVRCRLMTLSEGPTLVVFEAVK